MSSFQKLWENIQSQQEMPNDDRAMSAIRTGLGVNDSFWDDFLKVINNSEGLSELLEIPVTKISKWHANVKNVLEKVRSSDGTPSQKKNKKLLKTGLPNEDEQEDNENIIDEE